jgi:hypothetical protein
MERGGLWRRLRSDRPGKLVRNPLLSADSMVDKAGENNMTCAKATSLVAVGSPMALANRTGVGGYTCHNPDVVSQWPVMTHLSLS